MNHKITKEALEAASPAEPLPGYREFCKKQLQLIETVVNRYGGARATAHCELRHLPDGSIDFAVDGRVVGRFRYRSEYSMIEGAYLHALNWIPQELIDEPTKEIHRRLHPLITTYAHPADPPAQETWRDKPPLL